MKYTIYEIISLDNDNKNVYIGYSTNFKQRIIDHKNPYNNNPKCREFNKLLYKHIRTHGGWDNFIIKSIEIIECNEHLIARKREQYWIIERNATLNKIRSVDIDEFKSKYKSDLYKNKKLIKQNKLTQDIHKLICNIREKID